MELPTRISVSTSDFDSEGRGSIPRWATKLFKTIGD